MVTEEKIKALDFETFEQYMEYILESVTNGQMQQAKKLISEMSKAQKIDFIHFLGEYGQNSNVVYTRELTLSLI